MPSATVRWGAWSENIDVTLDFPAGWTVSEHWPHDAPDMTAEEIAAVVGPPLRVLARGKQRPCIVIDDLTRPTRGDLLIPPLLDVLDVPAEDVLIVGGVANHRPMVRSDLLKKLGPDVLAGCRFRNHFAWDNCKPVGETSRGTPIEINADYLACDLRVLVGSVIPHGGAGFSGGAKLLMPGIASNKSAHAYHTGPVMTGRYNVVETEARLDSEEAAGIVGVDYCVAMVPTSRMGVGAVTAGDVVAAHRAAVERAQEILMTDAPINADVGVFSLYPKDTEFLQHITALAPYKTASQPVVREGGTVVIIAAGSEGLGTHSLFGPGMRLEAPRPTRVKGRDLVFWCPGIERGEIDREYVVFRTWDETVAWLEAKHGAGATAAVFPCATAQLAR